MAWFGESFITRSPDRGGGALTLFLGTHCKSDSQSCGYRLEKRGLSQTQELSEGGLSEGALPVGAVVVSLASPWMHPGLAMISVLATVIRVIESAENDVNWGQAAVTTVITIGCPLIP